MIVLHQIDPIAISLGPVRVHWYGVMYLLGFLLAWWLGQRRIRAGRLPGVDANAFSDLLFYAMLGVVLGGRIGYVLFYGLGEFLRDPLMLFRVWDGGMSFHGGLIGVLAAAWLWSRRHRLHFFDTMDFIAPLVPPGLGFGRLGNYIGGELWGKYTEAGWGVVFPTGLPEQYRHLDPAALKAQFDAGALDAFARHPSQLYQAVLEGLVMFAVLWWFSSRPRPRYAVSGMFALLYGVFRFVVEFVRVPDAQLGYLAFGWLTMGQLLSLPLVALGLFLLWRSHSAPVLLYAGKEVLIHLSCKDMNRNALESAAWAMASEGFNNILALSGDYPASGYSGAAKPVFDIDSIGLLKLLSDMNNGLGVPLPRNQTRSLQSTKFFLGAVVTPYKLRENELIPQLLKLKKKIAIGARFIISQIGFDSRKAGELIRYVRENGMSGIPLIGNVFLMSARLARFFRSGRIAGVIVSDDFCDACERHSDDRRWFIEVAAKQAAIFKGLGYRGVYYGGVERMADVQDMLAVERSFAPDDWKQFAEEISYSRPGEFFYFGGERAQPRASLSYKFSKFVHHRVFSPDTALFRAGKAVYERSKNPEQGPTLLRVIEHVSKAAMFGCKDCGDCSLPDIAFLCPESQCAKNQRNGPCGGTRDGKCEVGDFECIWSRAYDRLKSERREQELLDHAPVVQDQSLRNTSAWGNTFRGVDHHHLVGARLASPAPKGTRETGDTNVAPTGVHQT